MSKTTTTTTYRGLTLALLAAVLSTAEASCNARLPGPDAQNPSLTFPARFAEGDNEKPDAGARAEISPDASTPSPTKPPRTGYQPDPEALRTEHQLEYSIAHAEGKVWVKTVVERELEQPIVTPRRIGRYAIELWIGRELVERVRFDFPLSGAEQPRLDGKRPLFDPPKLAPGVDTVIRVLVPLSDRATRAVLIDRATGETTALPWPPHAPIEAVDGGVLRGPGTH